VAQNDRGTQEPTAIAVLGLGYVGCVTAACLAELGHRIIGVDTDDHKVRSVLAGQAPFFEPGLEPLIARNVAKGLLTATTEIRVALPGSAYCFVCVGTPSATNHDVALDALRRVCCQIAGTARTAPLTVVIRSTVFPGTCANLMREILRPGPMLSLVFHPEFLREGNAVDDFMHPPLAVIGGDDPAAVDRVARLYEPWAIEIQRVSLGAAEMLKYACNAFHSLKIAFANEMGTLCERLGIPIAQVMTAFAKDTKLNLSAAYLRPGFAFGGSCLPKDLRALGYHASRLDLALPLLESVLPSNTEHLRRAVEAVAALRGKRIGVFGLAYKENTDDLRESPVVVLLERLREKELEVRVFDPRIQLDRIYGSNRDFLLASLPHIRNRLDRTLSALLAWADHLVLTQRPAAHEAEQVARSGLPILDLTGTTWPS
jgi:GDP-mannose 6-dehydrogenase